MILKKFFATIFILISISQLTGCATAVKFDPNTISATDIIGVWGTYSPPYVSCGGFGDLANLITNDKKDVSRALNSLKLYDVIEDKFAHKAPSSVNAEFKRIDGHDVVIINKEIDLIATSKKLGLDAFIKINTFMAVRTIIYNYQYYWRPTLKVNAKMIRASDGKGIWQKSVALTGSNIPKYGFPIISGSFGEIYNELAIKAVDILLADMRR